MVTFNDVMTGIVIPTVKVIIIFSTIFIIFWLIFRAFFRQYKKNFIFWIKYSVFRRPIPEDTASWCTKAMERGLDYNDTKMFLLLRGLSLNKINETLYIYKKMENQMNKEGIGVEKKKIDFDDLPEVDDDFMKGGQEHGRYKGNNKESEGTTGTEEED